jgi:hypothetical protein
MTHPGINVPRCVTVISTYPLPLTPTPLKGAQSGKGAPRVSLKGKGKIQRGS